MSLPKALLASLLLLVTAGLSQAADLSSAVLAEMNLARTQPQAYAKILEQRMSGPRTNSSDVSEAVRFLRKIKPLPRLVHSVGMSKGARLHVNDVGPKGRTGHFGSDRSSPFSRINQFGQWIGTAAENIYYGQRDARGIVCALIVDSGVRGRGHRKNIFNRNFGVTGIAHGGHAKFGTVCVMNFAGGYMENGSRVAGL